MRKKGFTLIELLIVIAILGIIAAGIVTALNVTGTIGKANLAKAKTFAASIENDLSINQVGKWSFESVDISNKTPDTSGYGNNGTVNGATWQDASTCGLGFGGCLNFNGADNYVSIPDNAFSSLSQGTITAWIYPREPNTHAMIYFVKATSSIIAFEIEAQRLHWAVLAGIWAPDATTVPMVKANKWQHVAVTVNSSGFQFYYDGKAVASDPTYGNASQPYRFFDDLSGIQTNTIGLALPVGSYADGRPMDGFLDEVAIYNQALTSYQIQHLFAQGWLRHQLALKLF